MGVGVGVGVGVAVAVAVAVVHHMVVPSLPPVVREVRGESKKRIPVPLISNKSTVSCDTCRFVADSICLGNHPKSTSMLRLWKLAKLGFDVREPETHRTLDVGRTPESSKRFHKKVRDLTRLDLSLLLSVASASRFDMQGVLKEHISKHLQ